MACYSPGFDRLVRNTIIGVSLSEASTTLNFYGVLLESESVRVCSLSMKVLANLMRVFYFFCL